MSNKITTAQLKQLQEKFGMGDLGPNGVGRVTSDNWWWVCRRRCANCLGDHKMGDQVFALWSNAIFTICAPCLLRAAEAVGPDDRVSEMESTLAELSEV